jgi:predicted DNA-binding transcriptional regulator AlpA
MHTNPRRPASKKDLYDGHDVEFHTGFSLRSISRWVKAGTFPAPLRVGRWLRWRRADVDAWVAGHRKKPA